MAITTVMFLVSKAIRFGEKCEIRAIMLSRSSRTVSIERPYAISY